MTSRLADLTVGRGPRLLVPLGVAALAAGLLQLQGSHHALVSLGLSSSPKTYTELAFNRPAALPTAVGPHGLVPVSFRVRRSDGATDNESWSVAAVRPDGTSTMVASGMVDRLSTDWSIVNRHVAVPCEATGQRVRLAVVTDGESIGFWVRCGETS